MTVEKRGQLPDLDVDGIALLKAMLKKQSTSVWTGFIGHRLITGKGFCEHGDEPWGYVKVGEFPEWPSDCQLLRTDLAGLCRQCAPGHKARYKHPKIHKSFLIRPQFSTSVH
jgi:hypothetical protein